MVSIRAPLFFVGVLFLFYLWDMIIQAENIEKSFGALKVLKGVDFQADKGEVVSIMGASGAGKSTLIKCLTGINAFESGEIHVEGYEGPGWYDIHEFAEGGAIVTGCYNGKIPFAPGEGFMIFQNSGATVSVPTAL